MKPLLQRCGLCLLVWGANVILAQASAPPGPYDRQVAENVAKLADAAPAVRARAAEALGFLRAYRAEASLVARLTDSAPEVRRQTALSLAWCGGRASLAALLERLDDPDWLTRQAAHVALCNVTGLELPFNSLAPDSERQQQAQTWRAWWRQMPADRPPSEVLALLAGAVDSSLAWRRERAVRALGALGGHGSHGGDPRVARRAVTAEWRPWCEPAFGPWAAARRGGTRLPHPAVAEPDVGAPCGEPWAMLATVARSGRCSPRAPGLPSGSTTQSSKSQPTTRWVSL